MYDEQRYKDFGEVTGTVRYQDIAYQKEIARSDLIIDMKDDIEKHLQACASSPASVYKVDKEREMQEAFETIKERIFKSGARISG